MKPTYFPPTSTCGFAAISRVNRSTTVRATTILGKRGRLNRRMAWSVDDCRALRLGKATSAAQMAVGPGAQPDPRGLIHGTEHPLEPAQGEREPVERGRREVVGGMAAEQGDHVVGVIGGDDGDIGRQP